MTRRIFRALVIAGLLTEVWALATDDTTFTGYTRELTPAPAHKWTGVYLAWHLLFEADVRAWVQRRRLANAPNVRSIGGR